MAEKDFGEKVAGVVKKTVGAAISPAVALPMITYDVAKELYHAGESTEAPPAQTEAVGNTLGVTKQMPEGSSVMGQEEKPGRIVPKPKGAAGKSPHQSRLVGTIEPDMSNQDKAQTQINEAQVQQYVKMKGWAALKAGNVAQAVNEKMAFVTANDMDAVRHMVDVEFPKFHAAQKKFQEEIEDIRTLRVNPYNYFIDAGRGGRVGAVLSAAVGQMAAGAGGVNNAQKALEAAINKDIETQAINIELQFKGVEVASKNIEDQIGMLETEILFRDKARALAWESANSIVQAAMQGAANETTYLGLQMIGTFASMQSIAASAALRAKQSTLLLEERVNNAYRIAQGRQLAESGQDILNRAFQTGRYSGAVDASKLQHPPQLQFQDPGLSADINQVRGNAAQIQAGQPGPAQGQPIPQPRQPSVSTRRPTGKGKKSTVTTEIGEVTVGEDAVPSDMTFSLDEAESVEQFEKAYEQVTSSVDENGPVGVPANLARPKDRYMNAPEGIEEPLEGKPPTEKQLGWEFFGYAATIAPGVTGGPEYAAEGSHAQRFFNDNMIRRISPTVGNMANRAIKNPHAFFANSRRKALTIQDAQAIRDAVEKYGRPPDSASNKAKEDWLYSTKFAEFYEANTSWFGGKEYQNNIDTNAFGTLLLRANAETRGNTARRKMIKEKVARADNLVHTLNTTAELLEQTSGDFMGFRYDPEEDSWEFTGFDESAMTVINQLKEARTAMGIEWIKSKDPAGRLSDQDIKLALSIINPAEGYLAGKLDMMQTMALGGGVSNVRKAVIAYMRAMAITAQEQIRIEFIDDIVPTVDSWRAGRDKAAADKTFFLNRYEEQSKAVPEHMEEQIDSMYAMPGGESN